MKLLLMNTCGAEGVAALADENGVLLEETLPGRGTSEHLLPALRRLFAAQRWNVEQLDAVGVVMGPGSFTGVRVGLAAAKGLCTAAGTGLVAMSRLALLAQESAAPVAIAIVDAGRGEYFCGVYRDGVRESESLLTMDATLEQMKLGTPVACEPRVSDSLGVRLLPEPGADALLRMLLARMHAGAWDDIATVDANYLRRTDAEVLRDSRQAER